MKIAGQSDRTIAPGQSEQVKVTITTTKITGNFTRSVSVTTNDPENHTTSLTCAGKVLVPFKTTPSIVSFGRIARDSGPVSKTVTVERGDGGPLALGLMPLQHRNVQAALREVEPGEKYELDITLSPPWPQRTLITYLTIKTGLADAPQDRVRVVATIPARLDALPTRFNVPRSVPTELDMRVRLAWDGEPGKVLEVTSSDERTSVRLEQQGQHQFVVLHVPAGYTPSQTPRPLVTLKTDDPEVPVLRIPVFGSTINRPARAPSIPSGGTVRRELVARPTTRPTTQPTHSDEGP